MCRILFFLAVHLTLFIPATVTSQYISSGFVMENNSSTPLEGVSVFYDGTSIGTITDEKGYFEMETSKPISALLVISYLGFESQVFDVGRKEFLGTILLKEKAFELNEVVLKPDTWSREKKLTVFRGEFLGKTQAALACRITNESDIRLYYNSEKDVLYAYAEVPIQVINKYLGYKIAYNLRDFEVQFGTNGNGLHVSKSTYTAGTIFFSERNENKIKKRYLKNRTKTYLGSVLHFMRSLAQNRVQEENYKIFKNRLQVAAHSEFQIRKNDGLTEVNPLTDSLTILYDDIFQSPITIDSTNFFIDAYGNHAPPQGIYFGGVMGMQRVANMLPLNYSSPKLN